MALRDTFLNMLGANSNENLKNSNSALKSSRDFLKYGSRDRIYPTWSDIKMPDSDLYSGYSYAVIQKRGNKVATLAKNNLKTWANPEIVDEYQKKNEMVLHPYLKLIEDSPDFAEKQFWKTISIYLDLAGRYYLGVIRNSIIPKNPNLSVITTDPTKFIMLNPYEIRRVIDKDGHVAGYIERKKDGRYREWPLHQIIEMRELNPFDPENKVWAMTDAAKGAVYTINQSGDYTRQSLHGNIDAPGIITTDVLLSDQDFANFRARVTQHQKGEPLFGNGAGAIKWDAMQIDLDKAALLDINEINRTELFAVSGTSKTSLGIEQSGTTRETARVQSEQFISDTAQPRLEDIVDFLNLDYKKHYPREYKQTGYKIEVESAVGRDYDAEQKATQLKQQQFQLAQQLIQSGYTTQSAYQFAEGQIDFEDLELEKGLDKPINPEEPEQPDENSPTKPQDGPQGGSGSGDSKSIVSDTEGSQNANNSLESELEPHPELIENGGSGSGNFDHAGRPGEVGGSAPTGSITATVDGPDDEYVAIDDKTGDWTDKIKAEAKTFTYDGENYKAVTAKYIPKPDVLLVEGEGRHPKSKERVDLLGYLDNNPIDKDVAKALHYMQLKSLDQLGNWEAVKAHLSQMSIRKEDEESKNSVEGEKSSPLAECTCEHDHKVEVLVNEVGQDDSKVLDKAYNDFLAEIRGIEKETIDACVRKVTVNAFDESDIIGKRKKASLTEKLKNALHRYWWLVFPMLANSSMNKRNTEFGKDIDFVFTNELQEGVDDNASRVAEGHMETILGDILEASNKAYTQVTEEAAAELIVKAYKVNPDKYSEYFDHQPTMADALSSIRKTDILEQNRKIYEKANKMAFEGYDRRAIIKSIRNEYKDISEKRATLIARNETSRAFGRSQYEADKQFLNSIGKMNQAYKRWVSRRPATEQDKICDFCNALIERTRENPIPFEQPFLEYGDSIEALNDKGEVKIFTANYESIEGAVLHPNCLCHYELVFKNDAGEFVKTLNGVQENATTDNGNSNLTRGISNVHDDESNTKKINGGKGSGNFGHSGRPGEVGGSSKEKLATSESRTRSFRLGDTVKITSKGQDYIGVLTAVTSARTSEIEIELPNGKNFKLNVRTATLVQENGEQILVPFYNVRMVKNVDAITTTPKERRTPKQAKALDEVKQMLKISDREFSYLKNNCSEESAIALKEECIRAKNDGIDLTQVSFAHNGRLSRTQGRVVYQPYTKGSLLPPLSLEMSVKWLLGGEYYKNKQKENYEKGWHTSPDIAGILRHEFGHVKSAQIVLRNFDASFEDSGKRILTSKEVSYRNEQLCESIVKNANSGYSLFSLSHGKGKDISDYAVRDGKYSEIIAESYSNSNFSQATKNIARQLDKEFKQRNNSTMIKIENNLSSDEWEDSLCTGYPMSEEDWRIVHGEKIKEFSPDIIKLSER